MRVGVVKMSDIAAHPTMRMDAEYWLDRADEKGEPSMAKPEREVLFPATDGVTVAAVYYGEPENCWRTEVRADDLVGQLDNMTYDETVALAEALLKACAPWRFVATELRATELGEP